VKARLVALAVFLAAVAVALVVPTPLAIVALVPALAALLLGPRLEVDRVGQAALSFVAMALGVVATRVLVESPLPTDPTRLSERGMLLAMPVVLVAAARAVVAEVRFGAPATLAAGLVAITAAGRAHVGFAYPALAASFLVVAFAALSANDAERASLRKLRLPHVVVVLLALAASGALTTAATVVLPGWHDAAMARILSRFRQSKTGFSDQLWLGSMGGMLTDDRVVLRLRGDSPPELLRGAVFVSYAAGRWEASERMPAGEVDEHEAAPPDGEGVLELENARKPERYFLPLDARDVRTSTGFFGRDAMGILHPVGEADAKRVWFRRAGTPKILAPSAEDLTIPYKLRPELVRMLMAWGAMDGPELERLERIEAKLRADYRYGLDFERAVTRDPVLDFLQNERVGHCEYFAASFALLGRAARIPTRVVTGYRVHESSPLGYWVVRQRHAHAWVEAYVDDRWITFDPTPPTDLAASSPSQTSLWGMLTDGVSTGWESVDDWLGRRTPFELSLALVGLVGVLLLVRALRALRERALAASSADLPLEGFVALSRALEERNLPRSPSETLARYALRVEATDELAPARARELGRLLRDYAELRYGGRGDARQIDEALTRAAQGL